VTNILYTIYHTYIHSTFSLHIRHFLAHIYTLTAFIHHIHSFTYIYYIHLTYPQLTVCFTQLFMTSMVVYLRAVYV